MFAHLGISLRLYFRNKMAMLYGYLFPTIFLVAFWVLYRYERVPLVRHMGELLTVTVLGGACFGLPTTMVSERERGVWRRYRVTPAPAGMLVASTVSARYLTLITAGLLQLALAMLAGMPLPRHPLELGVAFTCVALAFLGLGLVIAMLADNVPAVQALGQCIFLPMLIIGGVAVQLSSLPAWAQHVSAFFPGRYAVEAIQACVTGAGLSTARFSLFALLATSAAGTLAGAKMFRWDAQQRFAAGAGKAWPALALAAWAAVGLLAEGRGHIVPTASTAVARLASPQQPSAPAARTGLPAPTLSPAERAAPTVTPRQTPSTPRATPPPTAPAQPATGTAAPRSSGAAPTPALPTGPASWQLVTMKNIDADLTFDHLPPDGGIVTPIAAADEQPSQDVQDQLESIRQALAVWAPGQVDDPVQRVRNDLYVAAVPDVLQMEIERHVPLVVFDRIQTTIPKDQLIKILYWIALHPYDGDDRAAEDLGAFGVDRAPDIEEVRNRAAIYAVKLLGRLIGKVPSASSSPIALTR